MTQSEKDAKYKEICKKLGFIPREWKPPVFASEDDSDDVPHPFRVLTTEEHEFLFNEGYL